MSEERKKKGMPRGMYVGSALIGFAIFNVLLWFLCQSQVNYYLRRGEGNVAHFMTILILIPLFGFMLPMLLGIRTLRRAGREARDEPHAR